jgi:hypothetical protein
MVIDGYRTGAPAGRRFSFPLLIAHAVGPVKTPLQGSSNDASAASPSGELPTFNGLYPSIVARLVSQ